MQYQSIMLVDDSKTSRMITRRCLEIAGFIDCSFIEAENGLEAITILRENRVDLILSDLRMPKMDGSTLIRKLKMNGTTRQIPIIVVSSMGNDATEQQLLQIGADAVVQKPLSPDKLASALGVVP